MNWFSSLISKGIRVSEETTQSNLPEGVWFKCTSCQQMLYRDSLKQSLCVCHHCGHHLPIGARDRINHLLDEDSGKEHFSDIFSSDPLDFTDQKKYKDRLKRAKKTSNESEALLVFTGTISTLPVTLAVFEFGFMAGSMGSAVGEKFVRAVHLSMQEKRPFICFTSSGGARMQESVFSLMQMARTSAALNRLKQLGLPYICVLTHPTMGGVTASLGMLGHIHIAEPKALIGFAGPRVIEQTVNETLPDGFQSSEFLLENGAIDEIVDRRELRIYLSRLLEMLLQAVPTDTVKTSDVFKSM